MSLTVLSLISSTALSIETSSLVKEPPDSSPCNATNSLNSNHSKKQRSIELFYFECVYLPARL